MPWTAADAESHTKKADTQKKRETWAQVANDALARCKKKGGSTEECEGSAIRQANEVVAGIKEQEPDGPEQCVCPDCGYEAKKERGQPCRAMTCPKCGSKLVAKTEEAEMPGDVSQIIRSASELAFGAGMERQKGSITAGRAEKVLSAAETDLREALGGNGRTVSNRATFEVAGEQVALDTLIAFYSEAKTMKTVDGEKYPSSDFLVVEDPAKPSTWHLQVKRHGKADHGLMGGAKAALTSPGGHRGNKYEGPNKQAAITKLKALYKSEGMAWSEEKSEAAQGAQFELDVSGVKTLLIQAIEAIDAMEGTIDDIESDGQAVAVARDATDEDLAEIDAAIEAGRRAPVVVDFQMIKPGPGNARDRHYYPAEVLRRDSHVFKGVDIFATDHREDERSERTKVGKVLDVPTRFTEEGAPVAQVLIYDPQQAEKARNRADAKALETLECSIFGSGKARRGKVEEEEYFIVEELTQGKYLELVSKAGAGGHALNLAENQTGGEVMTDKEKAKTSKEQVEETEPQEVDVAEGEQERDKETPQPLTEKEVEEALEKTNLPKTFKTALKAGQYESAEKLQGAIQEAVAEVKKLTGSGQPFGQGGAQEAQPQRMSEEDYAKRRDDILKRHGVNLMEVGDA